MSPILQPWQWSKHLSHSLADDKSSEASWKVGTLVDIKVGNRNSSPPLQRGTTAAAPSFLVAATTLGLSDYRIKEIHGSLGLFFLFPTRRGQRGHPFTVFQGTSLHRRRGSALSVRAAKYWNKLSASVVTAPSEVIFKKMLENVWTEVFPHFPHWLNTQHSFS